MWKSLLDTLPRGYTLEEPDWQRRHRLLLRLLAVHIPGLALVGILLGRPLMTDLLVLIAPAACGALGYVLRAHRRTASVLVTGGLVYSSGALVGLTGGAIEAHFHFFIIIGFIALYQDWAPFLFNILFVVISHGIGSVWQQSLIFSHAAGQANPWLWSLIHGVSVLFACAGMMVFWRFTEESQREKDALARQLAAAEIGKRQFTSDLLVNLARRNQSMLHRQLDIINQLEESEPDPEALADLFVLDHLTTRVRRNAENLLVLSGEQPPRTWSDPVPLRDVLRAAIAETEDLKRVVFAVDERPAVAGHTVTDLTHLLAELTENAVRFSPPDSIVTIRARADRDDPGGQLITVEDWGVGMLPTDLTEANTLLADPPDVDLSVSKRLGFHVIARLAERHHIGVSLTATPGSGITAVVVLPSALFEPVRPGPARYGAADRMVWNGPAPQALTPAAPAPAEQPARTASLTTLTATRGPDHGWGNGHAPLGTAHEADGDWHGWWDPRADPEPFQPVAAYHSSAPHNSTVEIPSPRPRPGPLTAPAPAPAPTGPTPALAAPADPVTGLRRRVPQSHLAPELREPGHGRMSDPAPAIPAQHSVDAANALSRYQASRQAATDNGLRP